LQSRKSKVLDSARFHEIRFQSTEVSRARENKWTVHGDLTIHGQTRSVKVNLERLDGRYRGSAQLRQRGIRNHARDCGGRVQSRSRTRSVSNLRSCESERNQYHLRAKACLGKHFSLLLNAPMSPGAQRCEREMFTG